MQNPEAARASAQQVVAALRWSYIGFFIRAFLQFFAQVVLARHAGPAAFGQYAILLLVSAGLYVLGESGVSSTVVRTEPAERADRGLLQGQVLLTALLVAAASATAAVCLPDSVLATPTLRIAMLVMAAGTLAQIAGAFPLGLLRKALRFKAIQGSQALGLVLAFLAVGLPVAWFVDPLLGLAAYWASQQLIIATLNYAQSRATLVPPSFRLWRLPRAYRGFALNATATNIVNWSLESLDGAFIGRVAGARALGLYSTAYTLVRYPTNLLINAAQAVVFPASNMYRDEPRKLEWAHQRAVFMIGVTIVPLFVGISGAAEALIRLTYGSAWLEAVPVLAVLALAMPAHAVTAITGPILWGTGNVQAELRVQLTTLAALVVLLLVAVSTGRTIDVAFAVLAAYALRAWLICRALYRTLEADRKALASIVIPCLTAAAAGLGAGAFVHGSLGSVHPLAVSLLAGTFSVFVYVLVVLAFAKSAAINAFSSNATWLLERVTATLRQRIGRKEV